MKAVLSVSALAGLAVAIYILRPSQSDRMPKPLQLRAPKAEESLSAVANTRSGYPRDRPQDQRSSPAEQSLPAMGAVPEPIEDLLSGEVVHVARLRNVGSRTATSAIESWLWAATRREQSAVNALTRRAPRFEVRLEEVVSSASSVVSAATTLRVQRYQTFGPDRTLVWVELDPSGRTEVFLMHRTGADGTWQRDLHPHAYK